MTVTILPATVSDAASLTSVGLQAFSTDPLNKALENYSALDPTQRSEYLQWRTERNLDRITVVAALIWIFSAITFSLLL